MSNQIIPDKPPEGSMIIIEDFSFKWTSCFYYTMWLLIITFLVTFGYRFLNKILINI
jgi:hypothetical protein